VGEGKMSRNQLLVLGGEHDDHDVGDARAGAGGTKELSTIETKKDAPKESESPGRKWHEWVCGLRDGSFFCRGPGGANWSQRVLRRG